VLEHRPSRRVGNRKDTNGTIEVADDSRETRPRARPARQTHTQAREEGRAPARGVGRRRTAPRERLDETTHRDWTLILVLSVPAAPHLTMIGHEPGCVFVPTRQRHMIRPPVLRPSPFAFEITVS
jgi:hypothetical protein